MAKLVILGSSNAVPTENRENSHFALTGERHTVLVDCPGNPVVRLPKAGIPLSSLTDLILTHFHPDHVSGAPLLLMDLWLLGRRDPLNIYGLADTIERLEKLMDLFEWRRWPGFYPLIFRQVAPVELAPVLENEEFRIVASPVQHLIPAIGLRMEQPGGGKSIAYSGDTEPCHQVVRLASDVDILIHEATGASLGHTSVVQAAEIARQARAKSLLLIHYGDSEGGRDSDPCLLVAQAQKVFPSPVSLAEDFMTVQL
jgi:ribonuclease Z